jgi:hypothetical protein
MSMPVERLPQTISYYALLSPYYDSDIIIDMYKYLLVTPVCAYPSERVLHVNLQVEIKQEIGGSKSLNMPVIASIH